MTPLLLLLPLVFFAHACSFSLGGSGGVTYYYVLSPTLPQLDSSAHKAAQVLVRETYASAFIDNRRIIYSKDKATRASYQYAQWVDSPPGKITTLIIRTLEAAKLFSSVNREESSVLGDYQLNTELSDFYHDVSTSDHKVIITVTAELIDVRTRLMVDRRTFHIEQESAGADAEDAVEAFDKGLSKLLAELIEWLEKLPIADEPPL